MCTQIRCLKYWDVSSSNLSGESYFKTQQRIRHFVLDETPYGSKQSTLKVHSHITFYICVCVFLWSLLTCSWKRKREHLSLVAQTLRVNKAKRQELRRTLHDHVRDQLWTLKILPGKKLREWKYLGIKSTRHILWHNKWIYNGKFH